MQLSVVKGRVDFLPGVIIEQEFHGAYSIHGLSRGDDAATRQYGDANHA
jgi:hypothetical protein